MTRAHVIALRKLIEGDELKLRTIRAKLSASSSLFDCLCEKDTITHNPVKGVKRPRANDNEGETAAASSTVADVKQE